MSANDKKFEEIAAAAIVKAEAVKCSGLQFVEGLRIIRGLIQDRLSAAASEFKEAE